MTANRKKAPKASERWINGRLLGASLGFIALYLALNWTVAYLAKDGYFKWLTGLTTDLSVTFMRLIGLTPTVSNNNIITLPGRTLIVDLECTAIFIATLFAAFLAVYPTSLKNKLVGLMVGLPALMAINIFRLVLLGFVVVRLPNYFIAFHDYIWQVGFIIFLTSAWFIFIARRTALET